MKKILIGFAACGAVLLLLGASATRNKYVGTFVGDGAGVTNVAAGSVGMGTAGYSNASAFYTRSASNVFHGAFTGNAGGLTNITASSTNADTATWATNWTGANALDHLTVNGASDGILVAIRKTAGQTSDVFSVQSDLAANLFSVTTNGNAIASGFVVRSNALARWPAAPPYAGAAQFVNSNGVVFLLTSDMGDTWTATNKIAP